MFQSSPGPIRVLAVAALLSCGPIIHGQVSPTPAPPSDPKELMLAAARLNNLNGSDMLPWHIKASFQILDENGSLTDEGTYEEFWASPKSSKRIFSGKAFTQTEYTTDKGDFRASSNGDVPILLSAAHNHLVGPIPSEFTVEQSTYSSKTVESGSLKLTCLTPVGYPGASTFCLANGEPLLRLYAIPASSTQVLYNRILRFGGRAVAGDLKLTRNGKVQVSLHVDALESLDTKNVTAFTPPPDAELFPIPHLVNISAALHRECWNTKSRPHTRQKLGPVTSLAPSYCRQRSVKMAT